MMQTPELISWETLLSIGGVAALTLLITNLLRQRLGVSPRWLPLVLAPALMVLATVAVATTQQQPVTWQALALAVGNGLIAAYSISVAANEIVAAKRKGARTASNANAFWQSWF